MNTWLPYVAIFGAGMALGVALIELAWTWRRRVFHFCLKCGYKINLPLQSLYCPECGDFLGVKVEKKSSDK